MLSVLLEPLRRVRRYWRLTPAARAAQRADARGLPAEDPGPGRVVEEALAWLGRAQDNSATHDGGVARSYSLLSGWGASYPETTGYIIPTLLEAARRARRDDLRRRARRMLDWLVKIQLPGGGFQGSTVDATPVVPVVFNTGQILMGLAAGVAEFGDAFRPALVRAADWLVSVQDADGCWRRHGSPFAREGEKTYDAHVAWGLLEAARVERAKPYAQAALSNVRWALTQQRENGWFANCCLSDPAQPLTHTLGYALRGVAEAHRFTGEAVWLEAARKTADGLLSALGADGFLPGRLDAQWRGAAPWACLTGSAQVAWCWFYLYETTGERRYLEAARAATRYVRRTVQVEGPEEIRGAVKGSFPVDGGYLSFEFPNWAAKFLLDALLYERRLETGETGGR